MSKVLQGFHRETGNTKGLNTFTKGRVLILMNRDFPMIVRGIDHRIEGIKMYLQVIKEDKNQRRTLTGNSQFKMKLNKY